MAFNRIFNKKKCSFSFHCRYIAVTQPIKYAKHKNSRRVCLTILLVWAISAAIGSPIVLGLNNTPDRIPDLCVFYNSDFIIYSSLSSFYIPCIIMVFLYWNIFKVNRSGFSIKQCFCLYSFLFHFCLIFTVFKPWFLSKVLPTFSSNPPPFWPKMKTFYNFPFSSIFPSFSSIFHFLLQFSNFHNPAPKVLNKRKFFVFPPIGL